MLHKKLMTQQKAYQAIAVDVLATGWELETSMLELEALRQRRMAAEAELGRS